MIDTITKNIVELHRMRYATVDPGGCGWKSGGAKSRQAGEADSGLICMRPNQFYARGHPRTRIQGGQPVQYGAFRMVKHRISQQAFAAFPGAIMSKFVYEHRSLCL